METLTHIAKIFEVAGGQILVHKDHETSDTDPDKMDYQLIKTFTFTTGTKVATTETFATRARRDRAFDVFGREEAEHFFIAFGGIVANSEDD